MILGDVRCQLANVSKGSRTSSAHIPHITWSIFATVEQQVENCYAVFKSAPELRVFGISRVVKPRELESPLHKLSFLDVIPGSRAGDVFGAARLRAKVN